MESNVIKFINYYADSIDACEFDFLFAKAPSAGISTNTLMQIFLDAGIEALRFMSEIKSGTFNSIYYPGVLHIPGNIEKVDMNSFADFLGEEVIFEEGLEVLVSAAFKEAQYLKRVTLPKSLVQIGSWVFFHCYNLEEIVYNGSKEELFYLIRENTNNCFIPDSAITDYKFKITCLDGEVTLNEVRRA